MTATADTSGVLSWFNALAIFYRPRQQFEKIRHEPRIWLAFLIACSASLGAMVAWFFWQSPLWGQRIEGASASLLALTLVGTVLWTGYAVMISTCIHWCAARIARRPAGYEELFSMNSHVYVVASVGTLVGELLRHVVPAEPFARVTSLATVLDASPTLEALFASVELFSLWAVVLTAVGLQVVAQLSRLAAWAIAIGVFCFKLITMVGLAAVAEEAGSWTDYGAASPSASQSDPAGAANGTSERARCEPNLTGVVRDFDSMGASAESAVPHPDFENPEQLACSAHARDEPRTGLVADTLVDGRPVLKSTSGGSAAHECDMITSAESFTSWYGTDHPKDRTYEFSLNSAPVKQTEHGHGFVTWSANDFFPIDGVASSEPGFADADGTEHNFHFTYELHTKFSYRGGEMITFVGDDDLWLFINGKLALDLGGLHTPTSGTVKLDEVADKLEIAPGNTYVLSIFHAERHTHGSAFSLTTSIQFDNCDRVERPKL